MQFGEVQKHSSAQDCWVAIHGAAYNLTSFLSQHPGGSLAIARLAGTDATKQFDQVHPKHMLQMLPQGMCLGPVLPLQESTDSQKQQNERGQEVAQTKSMPHLSEILNITEFEKIAHTVLSPEAWAYYSSAADDEYTVALNISDFSKYHLRPQVLVNVKNIDCSTTFLGKKVSFPLYITATALGKLAHPEGEVVLTRAAGSRNIIQMMPTLASCSIEEMADARIDGQTQWFQLYVNEDRKITTALIQNAERLGAEALCVTVDAPTLGRRERDMRVKFVSETPNEQRGIPIFREQGAGRAISGFISAALCWDDIQWIRSLTKMPIILKGIQSGQDAVRAALAGVTGIIVSNHGGRQLDTTPSGIAMLQEVMAELTRYNLQDKISVFMDGGIRRGTDIYKALALGATGVGIGLQLNNEGRPFLYAMAGYGQQGAEHVIDLLQDELIMVMRLMGTPTIASINYRGVILPNVSKL